MKKAAALFLIVLFLSPLLANEVRVEASVNKEQISTAERLEYTITIDSDKSIKLSEPPAPQIANFAFVNMSSSSRRLSSLTNFKRQNQYSVTYHYYYMPKGVGNSKIASQKIKIDNKVYSTREIDIQVIKASGGRSSQPNQSPAPFTPFYEEDFWGNSSRNLGETRLLAEPEKQECYVGQPFVVSYYLYTDQMVRSFNLDDEKDYPGYGKSTYEQPNSLNYEVLNLKGKRVQRALIKRLAILPNQEGRLQVPSLKGRARIYEYGYINQSMVSEPRYVNVRALAQTGQPAEFNGAIGEFKVSESVSNQEISLGEAISFSLRIAGRGNFNQFVNPVFSDDEAQVSSPVAVDKLKAGIEGSRTLHYTIIPSKKGTYTLPLLSFCWFDTATNRYEIYRSPTQKITVKSANVISYFSGLLESGKPKTMHPMLQREAYPSSKSYLERWWYWLLVCLVLAGMVWTEYIARSKNERRQDPARYHKRRAGRNFKRYLGEATQAARAGSKEFYLLAERGFSQFLKDKYGISRGLSNSEKLTMMEAKGLQGEDIQKSADFWELCDRARFSPEEISSVKISEDLMQLKQLVETFSKNKRRRR